MKVMAYGSKAVVNIGYVNWQLGRLPSACFDEVSIYTTPSISHNSDVSLLHYTTLIESWVYCITLA